MVRPFWLGGVAALLLGWGCALDDRPVQLASTVSTDIETEMGSEATENSLPTEGATQQSAEPASTPPTRSEQTEVSGLQPPAADPANGGGSAEVAASPVCTLECPPGQVCDSAGQQCVACVTDADCADATPLCDAVANRCVSCKTDADCPADSPICSSGTGSCTSSCENDEDCGASPDKPVCDVPKGQCVACLDDADCAGTSGLVGPTERCDVASSTCVQCQQDEACGGTTPACLAAQQRCVQCTQDAQCGGATRRCDTVVGSPRLGACVACTSDLDCTSPAAPRCDAQTRSCAPCTAAQPCEIAPASLQATPASANFQVVDVGQSSASDVTWFVSNSGGRATGALTFTNSDPQSFPVRSNTCAALGAQGLAPGQSCEVRLLFNPTRAGEVRATLAITAGTLSVRLTANGVGLQTLAVGAECSGEQRCAAGLSCEPSADARSGQRCCTEACDDPCATCNTAGACVQRATGAICTSPTGPGVCQANGNCAARCIIGTGLIGTCVLG